MQQKIEFLKTSVQEIYQKIDTPTGISTSEMDILKNIITLLDQGKIRVATQGKDTWIIHEWIKQAIVAYIHYTKPFSLPYGLAYSDHTEYKYAHQEISKKRIVPTAYIRYGAYIADKTIIMPSFINSGAYIDEGTMIDTYASIGCCAQIGRNVHISAGTGIGGVLEPLQAIPTIIEDNCFIGARSEISEGERLY
jgi:2,3,4,5-tetrahydropyridine-2-carboxylate N-succinyltransferase